MIIDSFENPHYLEFMRVKDSVGSTACESNPDAFFPDPEQGSAIEYEQRRIAKALCRECPISNECLLYAIRAEEAYGIWGGLTPFERRRLK